MTDKLPEVGKRYRRDNQEYKCVGLNLHGEVYYFKMLRDNADVSKEYNLCDFYQFEPLEDNSQNTPQSAISEEDSSYCKRCLNDMSSFMGCSTHNDDICCSCHNELMQKGNKTPNPVDLKKEEVNESDEVEKAKEELKIELERFKKFCNDRSTTITRAAQALLDALDEQENQEYKKWLDERGAELEGIEKASYEEILKEQFNDGGK